MLIPSLACRHETVLGLTMMGSLCPSCFCLRSQCKYFLGMARNDYRFRDVAPSTVAVLAQVKVRVRLHLPLLFKRFF